jgi:predicted MFS family arabinose efflux permease
MDITHKHRRLILGLLLGAYILSYLDRQILYILIEPIKDELQLSDTQIGFLGGITFALFYATLGMPIAYLADRISRKGIISISMVVWSGMTAMSGMAGSFGHMLIARIGVAVGEAGCNPCAHSLISDLYPPQKRVSAMAVYQLGIPIGVMVGLLAGGWISEFFGWRTAFMAVGIPGLLFAVIFWFAVKEPVRGLSETAQQTVETAPSVGETLRHLWSLPSFRHLAIGTALIGFVVYQVFMWSPSFLIRSYGLSKGEAGTILALINGLGGGFGTWLGGYVVEKWGRHNVRLHLIIPGIALVLAFPLSVGIYLSNTLAASVAFMVLPILLALMNSGASNSLAQRLAKVRMRALTASILLFVINIVGLGLGPLVVGLLSDYLQPAHGDESLRYALMIGSVVYVWAGIHYFLGAKTLAEDLASVEGR